MLGVPRDDPEPPPACTDTSLSAYYDTGCMYALDIEGGRVYFASPDGGIDVMNLDCTGRKTLTTKVMPGMMEFFNGTLYFTNSYDCMLYKMTPGQEPEFIECAGKALYMRRSGTTLCYTDDAAGRNPKQMELLPLDRDSLAGAAALPGATVPRSRAFCLHVAFSDSLDASQNLNERVILSDAVGKTVPLHFTLSQDGTQLSVRPKDCVADAGSLSLYLSGDIQTASGIKMREACRFDVTLESAK